LTSTYLCSEEELKEFEPKLKRDSYAEVLDDNEEEELPNSNNR